ncbi:MAG: hypothetical protein ACOYN0_06945 [Phycisphaerales bacterium]
MTVRELLENAHLDALGLLDEDERAAFEKAFRSAPGPVRAQIRDEQSRWARMESCLPRIEPGDDLRERVLAAIRSEVELETASEALIALTPGELDGSGPLSGEVESMRRRKVPAFWQGAAIAMFSVSIVLGGAFVMLLRDYSAMASQSRDGKWLEQALALARKGQTLSDVLVDPSAEKHALTSAMEGCTGALWTHPNWENSAILFTEGLKAPQGTSYRVIAITEGSKDPVVIAADIQPNGSLQQFRLTLPKLPAGTKLAVVPVTNGADGDPVLTYTIRSA